MELIARLKALGEPEVERPDRVVEGDPVHRTWVTDEEEGLVAGLWQSTPGSWRATYEEWEYIRVLEGRGVLRPDSGAAFAFAAGDSFVIRRGWDGIWEVEETVLKEFVIHL